MAPLEWKPLVDTWQPRCGRLRNGKNKNNDDNRRKIDLANAKGHSCQWTQQVTSGNADEIPDSRMPEVDVTADEVKREKTDNQKFPDEPTCQAENGRLLPELLGGHGRWDQSKSDAER